MPVSVDVWRRWQSDGKECVATSNSLARMFGDAAGLTRTAMISTYISLTSIAQNRGLTDLPRLA